MKPFDFQLIQSSSFIICLWGETFGSQTILFTQKILEHGSTFLTEPQITWFTPKITKFLKNMPIFEGKSLKWLPFLAKITLKDGYGFETRAAHPCPTQIWVPPGVTPVVTFKLNSYSKASIFLSLCRMRISIFWGQERLTDRSISKRYLKAILIHEFEKVQLQERYTLVTQDSIVHLKTLCMSVLSLVVALESEWNATAHRKAIKKTLSSMNSASHHAQLQNA